MSDTLICVDCSTPIPLNQIPVVLSWKKVTHGSINVQRPDKALHINCDLRRRGKSERAVAAISGPEPTAKEKAATSPKAIKESKHDDSLRIFRIVKGNPRKEGTHGWNSFNLVKDGMTVEEYLKAGGRRNDLQWDVDHKFVQLRGQEDAQPAAPPVSRDEEKKARVEKAKPKKAAQVAPKHSKKAPPKKQIHKKGSTKNK